MREKHVINPLEYNLVLEYQKVKQYWQMYNCVIYYDYDKVPGGGSEWLTRIR